MWALPFERKFLKAVHYISKYLLSTCCVPGTVGGPGDLSGNKREVVPALQDGVALQKGMWHICSNEHLMLQ